MTDGCAARLEKFLDRAKEELEDAYEKHGTEPWGRHEFYAILKEEVDEVWDVIKQDERDDLLCKEMAQVVAVCMRFIETGDRYDKGRSVVDDG